MADAFPDRDAGCETLHASCVSVEGAGLLILGASGRGKSALALEMMALGAALVADDRVILTRKDGHLVADVPAPLSGLIEARGMGLLKAHAAGATTLRAAVTLDHAEEARLPERRQMRLLGLTIPLFQRVEATYFPAALVQYLKAGLWDDA